MQIYQRINSRKILLSCIYEILYTEKLSWVCEKIEEKNDEIVLSFSKEHFWSVDEMPEDLERGEFEKDVITDVNFESECKISRDEFSELKQQLETKKSGSFQDLLDYQLHFAYDAWKMKRTDLAQYSFDEWVEHEVEMDYLMTVWNACLTYREEIKDKVNQYVTTFSYQEMDVMDQALFLLWYTEFMEFQTPKEVLINELVELAKRYSRDGSAKVIHGIFHHLVN